MAPTGISLRVEKRISSGTDRNNGVYVGSLYFTLVLLNRQKNEKLSAVKNLRRLIAQRGTLRMVHYAQKLNEVYHRYRRLPERFTIQPVPTDSSRPNVE
ncbi:MAG: hypothetical protein GVY20_04480 [Bacteroidetes bacterium]|nr:hypothetical protein [Bacteroidota bacterium]